MAGQYVKSLGLDIHSKSLIEMLMNGLTFSNVWFLFQHNKLILKQGVCIVIHTCSKGKKFS